MNREIKFRGKTLYDHYDHYASPEPDTKEGTWVYGDLITEYPYHKGLTIVENGVYHEVAPETVGQYTGTDIFSKGFKGVYVGDLFQDESGTVLEVIFEDKIGAFGAWRKEGEWLSMQLLKMWCELVGNKWDNSELLEVLDDEA